MNEEVYNAAVIYGHHGLPSPTFFQKFTSSFRIKPSLFIAGAQKAGTTSLAAYLSELPGIIPPWQKEISFFNNDERYALGENWYRSFFASNFVKRSQNKKFSIEHITFDASANYFEEPKSAERIKKFDPEAKVIIILRDPAQRAWSHYKMAVKYGFETKSFKEALELEDKRIDSNTHIHNYSFQRLGYRTKGEYINFLPQWEKVFGKNLLILFYENLFMETESALKKIHDFLGLKSVPDASRLHHLNKGEGSRISSEDEQRLRDHYIHFNIALSDYLKTDLPWPK